MLLCCPSRVWERALATKAKTKSGAIAFKPPTNMSPKRPITVNLGTSKPSTAPTTTPMAMRLIRLVLFQVEIKRFITH